MNHFKNIWVAAVAAMISCLIVFGMGLVLRYKLDKQSDKKMEEIILRHFDSGYEQGMNAGYQAGVKDSMTMATNASELPN